MKSLPLIAGAGTLLAQTLLGATAGNWPQWRGPAATGTAADATPPLTWSETQNVKWKYRIPGYGTSTPINDRCETLAIKRVFGDLAPQISISSTKSMTGHLLGGAGGLESVVTALAVHHQVSPPTINIFEQDPECDLDYCANTARDIKIDVAIKNNFGFGGTNGTLAFKRI